MSTPPGHPDYQAIVNTSTPNLFPALNQTLTPGLHSTPVMANSSWGSVTLSVQPTAGQAKVFIRHFTDSAGANEVGNDEWNVNPGSSLNVRTPLRASYIRVDINNTGGVNLVCRTYLSFQSTTADRISYPVGAQQIFDIGHALATGVSKFYSPPFIASGRAMLFFAPHDTAGKFQITLFETDETGTAFAIPYSNFGATSTLSQLLELPDQPLVLQIQNTDTVSHTYDVSLVIPAQ